mmetsp:Transcript_18953/g.18097  ORF Transcript_18953/g.18097 Transcript_18953/m.18097 type:complete len:234 (+) Transcript_18953:445-1146(+)
MICPKLIFETAPVQSLGLLGSFINTSISTGVMVTGLIGLGFQDASSLSSPEEVDNFWRVVFLFPILFNLFQLIMLLFVYKNVSIVQLLSKEQDDAALALIKKVYRKDQNHGKILSVLKADVAKSKKTQSKETFKDAICDKKNRLTTWMVTSTLSLFYLAGSSPIAIYSNRLLTKMNEDGDFFVSSTVGAMLLSVANCVGAGLSPLLGKVLGTRPIMILGQFIPGLLLITIGVF